MWNAWRNADSTWLRERRLAGNDRPVRDDAWGSTDVTRLRVRRPSRADGPAGEQTNGSNGESSAAWIDLTSQQRSTPDDGNGADRTVMGVVLPFEVRPEETVEVEVEWKGKIRVPCADGIRGRLLLHRAVVSEARRARGSRLEHQRQFPPPSSTPITASTTCASPSRASSSWAPPAAARR